MFYYILHFTPVLRVYTKGNRDFPNSGTLVTFTQFCFVAVEGLIYHYDPSGPFYLKQRLIPLSRWLLLVLLFFATSVMNNASLGFHISIPVYIIFRGGGTFVTMVMGWFLLGKKYTLRQVTAVFVLTFGVFIATLSNAKMQKTEEESYQRFMIGVVILCVAQLLSSGMGLIVEVTYSKYGSSWREGLFYTHALAIPFFLPFYSSLWSQFKLLCESEPVQIWKPLDHFLGYLFSSADPTTDGMYIHIPRHVWHLIVTMTTQYLCVRGVNMLSATASALTLTIILNVRKFVSLLLSIIIFKNHLGLGGILGVILVFGGAGWYSYESNRRGSTKQDSTGYFFFF